MKHAETFRVWVCERCGLPLYETIGKSSECVCPDCPMPGEDGARLVAVVVLEDA